MGDAFKMSTFQLALTGGFIFFIVVGFIVLSIGDFGSGGEGDIEVTIWGTMPSSDFDLFIRQAGIKSDQRLSISYVSKSAETYNEELIEALASGEGPDIFFLSHEDVIRHQDKIVSISYEAYPRRDFEDAFIEEAQLFMNDEGVYAVPFLIDPMVTYWNVRLLSNAGISRPPQYWDEFFAFISPLTKVDTNLTITQSAFALGESENVTHVTDIVSALLMQNGIDMTRQNTRGVYQAFLISESDSDQDTLTSISSLNFYTQFSNPSSQFYTWNRSLPSSFEYFIQDDLALYLGYASEYHTIRDTNPNLAYDVAPFPQVRDGRERITAGRITGLAIPKTARDKNGAFTVIQRLTTPDALAVLSDITDLPPVHVGAFISDPTSSYTPVFQQMALWSRGWLEPHPAETDSIFRDMITSITSGQRRIPQALRRADQELDAIYQDVQ